LTSGSSDRLECGESCRRAAPAGCGQGEDARALPDKVALGLRRQARDWLKADLAAYAKLAQRDDPAAKQAVRERLEHWRQDADLAGLRDPVALKKLPEDEREAWRALWSEVASLQKKAEIPAQKDGEPGTQPHP
jgi:hypothetical protein